MLIYWEKMKKILTIISAFLFINICLFCQDNELIKVKAGKRVADYFPVSVRYRYPDFKDGRIILKNGNFSSARLNYNLLLGEMEYIQSRDTLFINNTKNINSVVIAADTFFYDNGYIELISSGPFRVGLIQIIKLRDIERKGAMGATNRNSTIDAYNSVPLDGNIYGIVPNEDWVFQKKEEYFLSDPSGVFVQFSKRNVMQIFPQKKDAVEEYLKSNKIKFNSRDDLLKLAEFLGGI